MVVEVNPEGLTAAATQLAGTSQPYTPAVALPPGADLTSVSAVERLNAASAGLVARLNHACVLRELGGQAVANTAQMAVRQDEANAQAISNGRAAGGLAGGVMSVPHVAAPTVPDLPQMPAALAPLPGEAHSQALYGGPGSNSVYQFADQWSRYGDHLSELAETLNRAGQSINENWDHGQQQAGANTLRHGSWAAEMSEQAHSLAGYARTVAEGFDTAKASTPSPQEFANTRAQLQDAMRRLAASKGSNAAEVQQLTQKYAGQQAEATDAVTGYHGRVTGASFSTGGAKDAPPITGGGTGQDSPFAGASGSGDIKLDAWKLGDKRHYPYMAGPGGPGPAQPADGPPWVEIGPGSGNFVRSDELPGVEVLKPGALGPAPFYEHGNEVPYIELGPNTGVWVPQTDFPGAQFRAPGALGPYGYEEYLPGSGIWVWADDLIPEPYNPRGPLLPPQTTPAAGR
jgi:hypothetical protein